MRWGRYVGIGACPGGQPEARRYALSWCNVRRTIRWHVFCVLDGERRACCTPPCAPEDGSGVPRQGHNERAQDFVPPVPRALIGTGGTGPQRVEGVEGNPPATVGSPCALREQGVHGLKALSSPTTLRGPRVPARSVPVRAAPVYGKAGTGLARLSGRMVPVFPPAREGEGAPEANGGRGEALPPLNTRDPPPVGTGYGTRPGRALSVPVRESQPRLSLFVNYASSVPQHARGTGRLTLLTGTLFARVPRVPPVPSPVPIVGRLVLDGTRAVCSTPCHGTGRGRPGPGDVGQAQQAMLRNRNGPGGGEVGMGLAGCATQQGGNAPDRGATESAFMPGCSSATPRNAREAGSHQ